MIFYILSSVNIELVYPDDTTEVFTLNEPNGENPYWFKLEEYFPSGNKIYKDPLRRKNKHFSCFYPVFHFFYSRHSMFTTKLLVAKKIKLVTGLNNWKLDCLMENEDSVRSFESGLAFHDDDYEVLNGEAELILKGKEKENWKQILRYYFYYVEGLETITVDSTAYTVDNTDIIVY